MSPPIEKFNATLGGIVGELKGAASTRVNEATVTNAANGSYEDALSAAGQMSTEELLALKARLSR